MGDCYVSGSGVCKMVLNFKIKLYTIDSESAEPELLNPFFCHIGDIYAELQSRLEKDGCVDWQFQFWDFDDQCRIRNKFKAMNLVSERVYVILEEIEDGRRLHKWLKLPNVVETGSNNVVATTEIEFPSVDVDEFEDAVPLGLEEAEVTLEVNMPEVPDEQEDFLQSKLISQNFAYTRLILIVLMNTIPINAFQFTLHFTLIH